MRFKKGDKLIVLKTDGNWCKKGQIFIVDYVGKEVYVDKDDDCTCKDHEVELLEVYNSPLYQALL